MKTTLMRKAFRDMRGHLGAYIACAMVMAIGVMMFASMTQVVESIPVAQQDFYEEYRFADVFASVRSMPVSRLERIAAVRGVKAASVRLRTTARVVDENRTGSVQLQLISYDPSEDTRLNDILVSDGSPPAAGSFELCLSENFYKANNLSPGDTLELSIRGRRTAFTVSGSYMSPEFIYIMPEGSLMPDDKNYGIAYVPLRTLSSLLDRNGEADDIALLLEDGVAFSDIERDLENAFAPYGLLRLYERADQASHSMLEMEIESMRAMVSIVPVIFLAVGALIMTVIVKRLVEQQHEQIGLMKAYGYTPGEVLGHYSLYGVFIGVLASILGGVMGAAVAGYMADLYRTYFVMPGISGAFAPGNLAALSLLSLVFSVGASLYGARGVLRLGAAEAMRPPAPPSGRPILLERIRAFWNFIRSTTQMSLRNLFRARSRSVMTMIGLVVCYALTAAVFAFNPMMDFMIGENFLNVNRYDAKILLSSPADARTLESSLLRMKGASQAEAVFESAVTVRKGAVSKDTSLLALPASSQLYRLYDDQMLPVPLPDSGVVLTYRMAKELGVRPGDEVLLDIPWLDEEVRLPVAALSEQYMSNTIIVARDAMPTAALRMTANGAMISATDRASLAALMERLDESKNVASVQSVQQILDTSAEMMQTSTGMLNAMALMAVFSGFAIVYNAATVILSERTRELASMRILGFSLGETVRVVALEELLLCLGGIVLGIPLAGSIMAALAAAMTELTDAMTIPPNVPPSSHMTAALCILGAWLAAVGITARKVRKQSMTDVLKGRD